MECAAFKDFCLQSTYAGPFAPVYQSAFNPPALFLLNDLTIWRVPPGGGAAQVWFQNATLDGVFGPNGIRVDEKSEKLYVVRSLEGTGSGFIYTLPLVNNPQQSDLKLFHAYTPGAVPEPDFGVARERCRSGPLFGSCRRTAVGESGEYAFDNSNRRLLVTNHASLTGLPDRVCCLRSLISM